MSSPSTTIFPAFGRMSPPMSRRMVLFPEPEPPRMTEMRPLGNPQERESKTFRAPKAMRTFVSVTGNTEPRGSLEHFEKSSDSREVTPRWTGADGRHHKRRG